MINIQEKLLDFPKSNRGLKPAEYVMPLALMFCGGGRTMEDIREIEIDRGLRKICGLTKVPGSDAIGQWIRKTENLAGLKSINERLVKEIIARSGKNNFTLDTDATLIETEKECAEMHYEGFTAFSVLLSFLADLGLCVCSDYRNGAVHAGVGTKDQIERADDLLKSLGKKLKYSRSDSAGYSADVFNSCSDRGIIFTITADQDAAVKRLFLEGNWAVKTIATLRWQLIFIAGKVIEHGRQLFLKVEDAYFLLLKTIRDKIRSSLAPAPV
ncbi:transposase [Candidatus Saganbacteria bacterium]|nr:transposase [Candidatus Saganbacteria bacterium]